MFHVVSCDHCGSRHVSCGSVWPAWMWFRVASVEREMLHVVSSGLHSFRDVSCGFVLPAWSAT